MALSERIPFPYAKISVYSSVGRMFALSTVPEIRAELINKEQKCKVLVTQMDEKKIFLLKSLKEQENNLRELVQSRKEPLK